ncbi:DNA ligase D [bacterium LRH843]|nr:DNA ligase D [bacterium LRH843]
MKPMLLASSSIVPKGKDWIYEAKYDGFRCLLKWHEQTPTFISRNGHVLNEQFPELVQYCEEMYEKIRHLLPIFLDGEIVHLVNDFKSEFSKVQLRGRMRNQEVIINHAATFPCHYIAFDLLRIHDEDLLNVPLTDRKEKLKHVCHTLDLPRSVNYEDPRRIQAINIYKSDRTILNKVVTNHGEGVVAKNVNSLWTENKRTDQWKKIKNWRFISVILTKYDQMNGYFHGAVYKEKELNEIVIFKHGFKEDEEKTLISFFQSNGTKTGSNTWELPPSVCVIIASIDFDGKMLREPRFHAFDLEQDPIECTWQSMQKQLHPLPTNIAITHLEKPIWPILSIKKDEYLVYLQQLAPYLLPFLKERHLTVIRYPHGADGERFFQKNCPDYAPKFIKTDEINDINYILCNDIETLLWLGNQLALEFHIPFQTRKMTHPSEIVFDLDPPSSSEFSLAIEAATRMKAIFDQFKLHSFVKTSGGKGLQLYIPLPERTFTYKETRIFTEFVCRFLVEQEPGWFTLERLKKNRGNKLYLDYVQHEVGKTIIAPYSPRGNEQALVATPLNWNEVTESLSPNLFTLPGVIERLNLKGNPFHHFQEVKKKQPFADILKQLQGML